MRLDLCAVDVVHPDADVQRLNPDPLSGHQAWILLVDDISHLLCSSVQPNLSALSVEFAMA